MWHSEHKTEKHCKQHQVISYTVTLKCVLWMKDSRLKHWRILSCLYHAPAHYTSSLSTSSLFTSVRPTPHSQLYSSHHTWSIWYKFVNLCFRKSVVQGVESFSILICLELWYFNEQIIKTAAVIYLILVIHSEKDKTNWLLRSQSFKFSFRNMMLILRGGWGKLNIR